MLATNEAGTTPESPAPAAFSTTMMGGRDGAGLASNRPRLTAATVANADTPRQTASCAHQRGLGGLAAAALPREMRASMRFHTSGGGCTGGMLAVNGINCSCHDRTAARRLACAGSSASKRRRAGPRKVPVT